MNGTTETQDVRGFEKIRRGVDDVGAGIGETVTDTGKRYRGWVEKAGEGVRSKVSVGTKAFDGRFEDAPWKIVGLDERRTRIAREVVKEVVPKAVGDRAAAFLDGVATKAGIGGAGMLLRIPLKPIVAPVLLVMGVIETAKTIRDIRNGVVGVAARVDEEMAAEAGRTDPTDVEAVDS